MEFYAIMPIYTYYYYHTASELNSFNPL